MRYRKKSYTGTERPASISHMIERMGGGGPIGGGKLKNPFKTPKQKRKEQGMKTDSQYQSQQKELEGIKAKHGAGSTGGKSGIVKKSSSLENQKVVKRKKKKVDDLDSKEFRKHEDLRKKQADMEAEGRANRAKQKEIEKLYGGWITPKGHFSKANVRKRIEPTKTLSMWKGIKKRKKANQDKDNWKSPRPDRPSSQQKK